MHDSWFWVWGSESEVWGSEYLGFRALGAQLKNNYSAEMWSGFGEGAYLRLIDFVSLNSRLKRNKEEEKA